MHLVFSKSCLSVGYIPGKENIIAVLVSRWAYPAFEAYRDASRHRSMDYAREMQEIEEEERSREKGCLYIRLVEPPVEANKYLLGKTRVEPIEASEV